MHAKLPFIVAILVGVLLWVGDVLTGQAPGDVGPDELLLLSLSDLQR